MRIRLYILLLLPMVVLMLGSCTVSQRLRRADKAYEQQAYATATERYRKVLPKLKREQQPPVLYNLAESSRLSGNTRQAENYYERATRNKPNPAALLGLAKSQQANEKYEAAVTSYEKYLTLVPQDTISRLAMEACMELRDSTVNPTRYLVLNVGEFNSNRDDFAPAFGEDDYSIIYFTSSRDAALGKKSIVTGQKSTDVFFSKQSRNGKWEKPQPVLGGINTKNDEGVCTFNYSMQTMYFTQCLTRGAKIGCSICISERDEENIWANIDRVEFSDSTFNVAHPSLSEDETELYFTSDMPEGQGGFDIWMVNRLSANDAWGEPINLGAAINTSGNEMYPYIRDNGVLYFASDGHKGFGGLDIFKATRGEQGGWLVENLGMPINSSADDFSIIFEKGIESGYFASRRKGGKGGDDIYRFVLPEAKYMFMGSVRDFDDALPMADASVKIISSDGELKKQETGRDGLISLQLQPETDYLVTVTKPGYFNQKTRFSTKGLEEITTLRDEFIMRSMASAVELENILYDFGKWDLRAESEESLDQLVEVLNDNPGIAIEIQSHTDSRGDSTFNMDLSQKRAQSVVDYLVGKGIDAGRLQAKGYGATQPRVVSKSVAAQYKFMDEGDVLSDDFINTRVRSDQEEEIVDQLNRRTEFKVVSSTQ